MKKFTENKISDSRYARNETLKNELYVLIEETLTPYIDGIDLNNLTLSGKDDLVNELIKIVENSNIDAMIDVLKELKPIQNIKNKETDTLLKAFESVKNNNDDIDIIKKIK